MLDDVELKKTAELLRNGGIVVFPTETVYGIGANGLDEKAVKKLYNIKQRPLNKPISLLVSNMDLWNMQIFQLQLLVQTYQANQVVQI